MQDLAEHHLVEYMVSSQTIASGGMLTVKRDQVRLPNGNTSQREYVTHPGAVVVVPMLPNGNVILEKQFRYALNQVFIERGDNLLSLSISCIFLNLIKS